MLSALHESGDNDQRHRRIDIGSLSQGQTGGDGVQRKVIRPSTS